MVPEKRTGLAHATAYASFRQVLSCPVVYGSLWAGCPVRDRSNLQFSIIPVHHRRDDRAIVAVANDEFQWGRSIAVPVNRVKRQQIPDDHTKFRPYGASAAAPVGRVRQANVLDHYTGSLSVSCCTASQPNRAGMIPLARLWAVYLLLRISGAPTRPGGRSCE